MRALAAALLLTAGVVVDVQSLRLAVWAHARRDPGWLAVAYELNALGRDMIHWGAR